MVGKLLSRAGANTHWLMLAGEQGKQRSKGFPLGRAGQGRAVEACSCRKSSPLPQRLGLRGLGKACEGRCSVLFQLKVRGTQLSTAQGEAGELTLLVGARVWSRALHASRGLGFGSGGGGTGKGIRCPRGQSGICAKIPWSEVAFPRVQVPGKQVFGEAPM